MIYIREIFDRFIACLDWLDAESMTLIAAAVILFFIQLRYYTVRYGRLLRCRQQKEENTQAGVSVITVLTDPNYNYVENTLPLLLRQDWKDYEVVLIDLSGDVDFHDTLLLMARADRRISITRLPVNPLFPISNKMALNIGIKAAHNENLIFTTPDSYPCSPDWLRHMAAAFDRADVVLGYCGMETGHTAGNRLMRTSIVSSASRWISAAMRGKPYRGTMRNMGFTKSVYFNNGGFNHLNINIGEDDLFLQRIAATASVDMVIEPESFMRRRQLGGPGWWTRERLLRSNAFQFYPARARRYICGELWSRVLLFVCITVMIVRTPLEIKIFAAALLLIRFVVAYIQSMRLSHKLGERRLWKVWPVYDLFSPAYEAILYLDRHIRRTPGLWR